MGPSNIRPVRRSHHNASFLNTKNRVWLPARSRNMDSSSAQSGFATGFIWGIVFTIVVAGLIGTTILHKSDIYGLGHWKLNIRSPPPSMWMNVGYW